MVFQHGNSVLQRFEPFVNTNRHCRLPLPQQEFSRRAVPPLAEFAWGRTVNCPIRTLSRRPPRYFAFALSFFLVCMSKFAGAQEVLVNDFYLDALAMIESGSNPTARGKAGERSAWQLKEQAWSYTSELRRRRELEVHAFAAAGNSTIARTYARTLLEDHCHRFVSTYARTPTPGELYAVWNLGFEGFRRRGSLARCPALTKDAAQRLINLLEHYSPARLEPAGGLTASTRTGRHGQLAP